MILSKSEFCMYVEEEYLNSEKKSMIDTILDICEKYNIDPEYINPLINKSIRDKLEVEYRALHMLKGDATFEVL